MSPVANPQNPVQAFIQGVQNMSKGYQKNVPAFVRKGVNPFSNAVAPGRGGIGLGLLRWLGEAAVGEGVSKAADKYLPPDVGQFISVTSAVPGPAWLKLGTYLASIPTAAGKNEDEIMRQIHADYYAKKTKAEADAKTKVNKGNQNYTGGGLEASGPADPAFRPPGAPPAPSPSQAAATTALPSQGPAPAATAPDKMNELARLYAEQKQMGTELGAEEMVRRMRAASPSRYSVPEQDLVKWAASNPALAYREMVRREGLTG